MDNDTVFVGVTSCCEPLEYSIPGHCECTFSQQLQETSEYSKTEEDGFLYGLLVRITLFGSRLWWIDVL